MGQPETQCTALKLNLKLASPWQESERAGAQGSWSHETAVTSTTKTMVPSTVYPLPSVQDPSSSDPHISKLVTATPLQRHGFLKYYVVTRPQIN